MKLFVAHKMTRNNTLKKVHVAATEIPQLLSQNTNAFGQATAQSRCQTLCSFKVNGATEAFGLAISRSRVQILLETTLRNNLRQVVYTYVPLSPSSITWYRPKGGDALRLGR